MGRLERLDVVRFVLGEERHGRVLVFRRSWEARRVFGDTPAA